MKIKTRRFTIAVLCLLMAVACCGTVFKVTDFTTASGNDGSSYGLINKAITVPEYENGTEVTSPSGKPISLLSGGRFVATETGVYTVHYANGETGAIRVFAEAPEVQFDFSYALDKDYGIGKRLELPAASIGSAGEDWTIGYEVYTISVYQNGKQVQSMQSDNRVFTFSGAGEYEFRYGITDVFGISREAVLKSLAVDKIVLNYEEVPETLPFKKSYNFGDVQVLKNGVVGQTSIRIEKPDGSSEVLSGTTFTPMQYGQYTVIFSGSAGGETIEERRDFEVVVSLSGLFSVSAGILSVTDGVEFPSYAMKDHNGNTKSGVQFVTESSGASIEFNNIIDLNQFDHSDDLIRFQALDGNGFYKMSAIDIYLTDAHNSNNTVRINYQRSLNESNTPEGNRKFGPNVLVGYSGTTSLIGLGVPDESVEGFVYDASLGWVSAGTCISDGAFNGASKAEGSVLDFNLRFDLAEKQVWVESRDVTNLLHDPTCAVHEGCPRPDHHCPGDAGYHNVLESEYHSGRAWKDYKVKATNCGEVDEYGMRSHIVRDLDEDYKDNQINDSFQCVDRLWGGFTTGEVYMKIVLSGVSGHGGIIISEIAGIDLSETKIEDKTAPVISYAGGYEFFEEEETRPYGITGEVYPLPEFSVTDNISANCAAEIQVKDSSGADVAITDNSFIPQKAGIYEIIVRAEDESGNKTEKSVEISVKDTTAYTFENEPTSSVLQINEAWTVPEVSVIGMSGIAKADAVIRYGGKEISVKYNDETVLYLSEEGILEYSILWTDYLGRQTEKNYSISVKMHGIYVRIDGLMTTAEIGQSILIPDFEAIDATQEPYREMEKTIRITSTEGTVTLGENRTYVCPNTPQRIILEYLTDGEIYETRYINVVSVNYHLTEGKGNIVDYFYIPAGITAAANETSLLFSFSSDGTVDMPYPVVANGLIIEMNTTTASNMNYFDIVLTDFYNAKLSVFLRIEKTDEGNAVLSVNGQGEKYTLGALYGSSQASQNIISLLLDAENGNICNSSGIALAALTHYDNGTSFLGFTDGIVRVSFRTGGVNRIAELGLRQIGNQIFNASITQNDTDNNGGQGPQIAYDGKIESDRILPGTVISIPSARAYDVLYGGESEVRVTVTDPKGNTVLKNALANETRSLECTEYGYYRVTYSAANKFAPVVSEIYRIYVLDEVPAELNVNGSIAEEIGVGDKFVVPTAVATDRGENVDVYIFLVKDYYYKPISAGELTLDKAGNYSIVYIAYDAEGNATRKAFAFEVR